ncbi:MAG: hypothetical protein KF891_12190 [Rhizobacter sp.]|nr:hypothetical protein [Rhizobacter sp.]
MRPLLACAALALGSACAGPAGSAPEGASAAQPLGVAQVLAHADALQGRTLTVTGRFAGWTGPCRGAPPRTRSDWMLAEASACLYVTGPVPAGLTPPPDTVSNGRAVQLRGRLERADDGRPYLVVPAR